MVGVWRLGWGEREGAQQGFEGAAGADVAVPDAGGVVEHMKSTNRPSSLSSHRPPATTPNWLLLCATCVVTKNQPRA